MNRFCVRICAALMLLVLVASSAQAQETMYVYIGEDALDAGQAQQIIALLGGEYPQAQWTLTPQGESLKELVLGGCAPDLAICAPKEALPWAKEGLLQALHTRIGNQTRMQRQVLDSCVHEESLFMAPLIARHRQMAVNRRLFEKLGLGYMLDRTAYPVWYPAQIYQILEEFLLKEWPAMDVWPAKSGKSAALEALTQAIFGGTLLSEDGMQCTAGSLDMRAGVRWLGDAVDDGLIGYAQNREAALARFVRGETAIFIDWTDREAAKQQAALEENGVHVIAMPYPSATGLPVRSFELTGVCAFESGESSRDALALQACALLDEHAQGILGSRGIWQDHALWPASLDVHDRGATLRSLLCAAITEVIESGADAGEAMERVQAAMDAYE